MTVIRTVLILICTIVLGSTIAVGKRNVLVMIGDDAGFESQVYNNTVCKTPHLDALSKRSITIRHAFTSVSSCSPSRSAILTGLPQHQNGMYGLHHQTNHFNSFDAVRTLPQILKTASIKTAIIGKKHVGPDTVYKFDYEQTEENNPMLQCARNITFMKLKVREFFSQIGDSGFLLYIGFNDVHRCGGGKAIARYGEFCEKFGDGVSGQGVIPDWKPMFFKPEDVIVPPFLPDTPATRSDLAAQYTSVTRMDAGVGMLMSELQSHGYLDETLIIFTADNGIPFPNAKTNLYESGMGEPMLVSSPLMKQRWGQISDALTSTTDIVPTVLDWLSVKYPDYELEGKKVKLTGKSMLPLLNQETTKDWDQVFASHDMHEVTMFYPMRVLRTHQYHLIHNLNYGAPYPLATDLYACPTFQDILNRTRHGEPTHWFKDLRSYYYRPEYELFDVIKDPLELTNLADDGQYSDVMQSMLGTLMDWRLATNDPWKCYPHGVIIDGGGCGALDNEIPHENKWKKYSPGV